MMTTIFRYAFHKRLQSFCLLIGFLSIAGCAPLSETRISESTAPADIATTRNPLVTGEYTIVTDSVEVGSLDPDALREAAFTKARKRCTDFQFLREYLGTGISINKKQYPDARWLRIVIQCKQVVQTKVGGFGTGLVEENSKTLPDAAYFDIHAEKFTANYDRVFATIIRTLTNQGDAVYRADKVKGVIVTGRVRHGNLGFPRYEQYVVALDKEDDTTTQVTFRLLIHIPNLDVDPDTLRPTNRQMQFTPAQRKFVYQRAAAFVDTLRAGLKK